jgi:predicted hydrolase (HD superfamily)
MERWGECQGAGYYEVNNEKDRELRAKRLSGFDRNNIRQVENLSYKLKQFFIVSKIICGAVSNE